MSVYSAISKLVKGTGQTVENMAKMGATGIYESGSLGVKSFKKRKGTYTEELLKGNIVPYKLKAPISIAAGVGITGYMVADGIIGAGLPTKEEIEQMKADKMAPGVLSNQRSPKPIDDMGATGDLVFSMHDKR